MRKIITLVFLVFSNYIYCQIKGVIIDSESKEGLPYVNIWIEDENIGTTSNIEGEFELETNINILTKKIVFSSLGYETKTIVLESLPNIIELIPKVTELNEVNLIPKKKSIFSTIGIFNKSKINYYFGCGNNPKILARFYKYENQYENTPYLKSIRVLTKSYVKDAMFNVRLYKVGENGEPENYLYNENIIGIAEKGKSITEIDVDKQNIKFPENGFFIAIEWLIIENNKYEFFYTQESSKKKNKGISFEPHIGLVSCETDENIWMYSQGKWNNIFKNNADLKNYKDKNVLLAIELTLTN